MTRLTPVLAALLAAALLAAGTAQAQKPDPDTPAWAPVAGLPFSEPEQLHARNGVLRVTLDAKLGTIEASGSPVVAQPFNGKLIGPTLHVKPGDTIVVTYRNATADDTNIHYHGLHVSPRAKSDNVFRTFSPGKTYTSRVHLPRGHSPGSYWYHAHFHGNTNTQVMGGMSGLLVVEGQKKLLPRALRGVQERDFAIRDLQTDATAPGWTALTENAIDVQKPTTRLVNGLLVPKATLKQGETQLWRLGNVGSELFYDVQLTGHEFTVIAEDGSPKWSVPKTNHLLLPPGKRYDVLVTGGAPGDYELITRKDTGEGFEVLPRTTLADVTVTPGGGTPATMPKTLDTPAGPITSRPVAKKRTFTFSFDFKSKRFARINGEAFQDGKTNVAPYVGTVEEWTLRNATGEEHPFHIHVNDFQVVEVNGKPYQADGLQDVVIIPHQDPKTKKPGEVVIRIPFNRYTGHFVFHCHILGHEDGGMMQTVQVRRRGQPITPPPSKHHHGSDGKGGTMRTVADTGDAAARWALICKLRREAAQRSKLRVA